MDASVVVGGGVSLERFDGQCIKLLYARTHSNFGLSRPIGCMLAESEKELHLRSHYGCIMSIWHIRRSPILYISIRSCAVLTFARCKHSSSVSTLEYHLESKLSSQLKYLYPQHSTTALTTCFLGNHTASLVGRLKFSEDIMCELS